MPASENGASGPGYQLLMDFFNNDWVIPTPDDLDQQLAVPKLVLDWDDREQFENQHRRPEEHRDYYNADGYYDFDSEQSDDEE
jgi:hypothetical protein